MAIGKLVIVVLAGFLSATQVCAGEQKTLNTDKDKVNYGTGVTLIRNFQQQGMEIDLELMIQGMKDALAGDKLLMNEADLRKAMLTYQTEVRQKQARARQGR